MLIEACLARGEQITGSGVEAIPTLRALAVRVGYPIETLDPRVTDSPSPRLVVVRRPSGPRAVQGHITNGAGLPAR